MASDPYADAKRRLSEQLDRQPAPMSDVTHDENAVRFLRGVAHELPQRDVPGPTWHVTNVTRHDQRDEPYEARLLHRVPWSDAVNFEETLDRSEYRSDYNLPLMVFDDTGERLFVLLDYTLYMSVVGTRDVPFGSDLGRAINQDFDTGPAGQGRRVLQMLYMAADDEAEPQPSILLFVEDRPTTRLGERPSERQQFLLHVNPRSGRVRPQSRARAMAALDRSYVAVGIWGRRQNQMYGILRNGTAVEFDAHSGRCLSGPESALSLGAVRTFRGDHRWFAGTTLRGVGTESDHQRRAVERSRPNAAPLAHALIWAKGQHMPNEYLIPADVLESPPGFYAAKYSMLDYRDWPPLVAELSGDQFLVKPIRGMFVDNDNELVVVTPSMVTVFGPPVLVAGAIVGAREASYYARRALFVLQYGVVYPWARSHHVQVLAPFVAAAFTPAAGGGLLALMTSLETIVVRMHDWEPTGAATLTADDATGILPVGSGVTRTEAFAMLLVGFAEEHGAAGRVFGARELFAEVAKYM